jgi:hypothetical protein
MFDVNPGIMTNIAIFSAGFPMFSLK